MSWWGREDRKSLAAHRLEKVADELSDITNELREELVLLREARTRTTPPRRTRRPTKETDQDG